MSRLGRAEFWLPLALLGLAAVGRIALSANGMLNFSTRDWQAYGDYRYWELSFDALSAATGVGLLTLDLEHDYTAAGRWVLLAIGLAGALLYLAALWQVLRRLCAGRRDGAASTARVVAWFLVVQVLAIVLLGTLSAGGVGADGLSNATWQAVSAFASLGWVHLQNSMNHAWLAILSLASALFGWVWLGRLLRWSRWRRAGVLGSYLLVLMLGAGMLAAFEQPRGPRRDAMRENRLLSTAPGGGRLTRCAIQVTLASGAGIASEQIDQRGISEGSKLLLALVVLVGGIGGGVGGGVTWVLLISAWRRREDGNADARLARAGRRLGLLLGGLTVVSAGALLLTETGIGSPYQAPPTLGDALLDAACASAGANLSSGLSETITGR